MGKKSRRNRSRKSRKSRKSRRNARKMRGGFVSLNGSNVGNTSMNSASQLSLAQGKNFSSIHDKQHGGQENVEERKNNIVTSPQMGGVAPVGDQGLLDDSLRASAHLAPLDRALSEISGMSDQAGGRRRRRKSRKSRKSRAKGRKARRTMRGGVSDVTNPSTLLTGNDLKMAVDGMNPEWKLVEDASAFNPRM